MKQIQLLDNRLVYIAVIFILAMMLMRSCHYVSVYNDEIGQLTSDYITIKKKTLKDSSMIYSQGLAIISNQRLADSLKKELKKMEMREPEVIIKTRTKTIIKTEIPLGADVIDDVPVIRLPKDFFKKDKWYVLGGTINRLGTLQIDSLVSYANFTYAIADTSRSGLWNRLNKKRDKVLSLKIDNPNMRITGMSNIYIQEHKKWWQTTGAKIGLGFILGLGVVAAIN